MFVAYPLCASSTAYLLAAFSFFLSFFSLTLNLGLFELPFFDFSVPLGIDSPCVATMVDTRRAA